MIGVLDTIHPTEGYSISVRYRRVDAKVTILGIWTHGKDIWGKIPPYVIQKLKSEIAS